MTRHAARSVGNPSTALRTVGPLAADFSTPLPCTTVLRVSRSTPTFDYGMFMPFSSSDWITSERCCRHRTH